MIWVIVDSFAKMASFIALLTINKTKDLVRFFLNKILRLLGLTDHIVLH